MAGVRFRTLNVLRKWVELQKYHFTEDTQMLRLMNHFLSTARLVGHEKIAAMIEAELFVSAENNSLSEEKKFYAPPMWREGFDAGEKIAVLAHVLPEELARQLTLLDHALYRKLQG
jgi:hypothetical protein